MKVPVSTYQKQFNIYKSTDNLTQFEEFSLTCKNRGSLAPFNNKTKKKSKESEYSTNKIRERLVNEKTVMRLMRKYGDCSNGKVQ